NEPACYSPGGGSGSNIKFVRSATQIPVPFVVVLLNDDGTWTLRNIVSLSNSSTGAGNCTAGQNHAQPDFNQGANDTTGLNTPGGVCQPNGFGSVTGASCNVQTVSFATLVRYRVRNDASGVPNLERFSSEDPRNITGSAETGFQVIARGIEDLQVQYT